MARSMSLPASRTARFACANLLFEFAVELLQWCFAQVHRLRQSQPVELVKMMAQSGVYLGFARPGFEQILVARAFAHTLPRPQGTNGRVKDVVDMALLLRLGTLDREPLKEAILTTSWNAPYHAWRQSAASLGHYRRLFNRSGIFCRMKYRGSEEKRLRVAQSRIEINHRVERAAGLIQLLIFWRFSSNSGLK